MSNTFGLISLFIISNAFLGLEAEIFRGFHEIRMASIFSGASTNLITMFFLIGVWFFRGSSDLSEVLLLYILANLISLVIASFFIWMKFRTLPRSQDAVRVEEILRITWPLWIISVTLFVLSQAGIWIVGAFRMESDIAIYGVAGKLVALVTTPLIIQNSVLPPVIAEKYSQNKLQELESILRNSATITGIPSMALLIILIFFGGTILELTFGEFYRSGWLTMAILSSGAAVNVWAGSCGQTLMLTGHQHVLLRITLACGAGTVLGALLLVDPLGINGVACVAMAGMVLQNILMLYAVKSNIGLWTHARVTFWKAASWKIR